MTREEAINIIKSECYIFNPLDFDKSTRINTALDIAIKALEQEPCEDAVDRKALDKALYERFHEEDSPNNITDVRLGKVRNFVKNFPSVTPTRKKGKWIITDDGICRCTVCGNGIGTKNKGYPFCHWCGADMSGAEMEGEE